jgi:hypothetical protein
LDLIREAKNLKKIGFFRPHIPQPYGRSDSKKKLRKAPKVRHLQLKVRGKTGKSPQMLAGERTSITSTVVNVGEVN